MKKNNTLSIALVSFFLLLMPAFRAQAQCNNADFETGDFTGWTGTFCAGQCTGSIIGGVCNGCGINTPTFSAGFNRGPDNNRPDDPNNEYNQIITTPAGGNDPYLATLGVNLPMVWPGSGGHSARIGNMWQYVSTGGTGDGETVSYTMVVTPTNCIFTYHYAVVMTDGGHPEAEQAYFDIKMVDVNNNDITCADYHVDATSCQLIGGFSAVPAEGLYYKPWSSVIVPLVAYIGQTVTITFTNRSCLPAGCAGSHYAYAYIDCECASSSLLNITGGNGCNHNATITAPAGFASYSWTGPGIAGAFNTSTIHINQPGRYVVSLTTSGNVPCSFSLDTIVPSDPGFFAVNFSASVVCAGSATAFTDNSTPHDSITHWAWDFNNDSITDDTTANPTYTFDSAGVYPVTLTVGSSSCSSSITKAVSVVLPPTTTFTATGPLCPGDSSTIVYTGNGLNSDTFNWSFDGGTVGPGSGPGPYVVSWQTVGTKNITLTVLNGNCASAPDTVPVVVNPTPQMIITGDTAGCSGNLITLTAGGATAYVWAVDSFLYAGSTITLSSDSSFTNVMVTGTAAGCSATDTVSVLVYPSPVAAFVTSGAICAGDTFTILFTGNALNNAQFTWNFGTGIADTLGGAGPISVVWNSVGFSPVSLTVSQYGCISTLTDTIPIQICNGIFQINTNQISIYPNPAKSEFTIQITGAINLGQLEIYDVLGQVLYVDEIRNVTTGYSKQIHLDVATGVYFVSLRDGDKHYTQKLVSE